MWEEKNQREEVGELSNEKKILSIPWCQAGETVVCYDFYVEKELRTMRNDQGKVNRYKNVYRGFFVNEAPEGLEANVVYYLKHIHALAQMPFPQLRDRYDLLDFGTRHIRDILARNDMAKSVAEETKSQRTYTEAADCYIVERPYSELRGDEFQCIERMTVWERLEYVDQFCASLEELYQSSKAACGRQIAAHRDVKISNGLILRDRGSFQVKLLDFSSVRFEDDIAYAMLPVPTAADGAGRKENGRKGGQGTEPYLMSRENTAPEIVDPSYPTTGAVDVYALGTMLASLFGYISDTERNPNSGWCSRNGWAKTMDSSMLLSMCFEEWKQWDKALGEAYTSTSWMEEYLRKLRCPFAWGDHPGSPNAPEPTVLAQVRELFFQATRIDPADRITLSVFRSRIHALKNSVEKETSFNPDLYSLPETIFLFHQWNLQKKRPLLMDAASAALKRKDTGFPVQVCWYQNPADQLHAESAVNEAALMSAGELRWEVRKRDPMDPVVCASLTDALYRLYSLYNTRMYEKTFGGTIHIFTSARMNPKVLPRMTFGETDYTYQDLLNWLAELSAGTLKVFIHSPDQPRLPQRSPEVRWIPLTAESKPEPKPAPEPVPQPEPGKKEEPVQEPQVPVESLYLLGAEGLFFWDEGQGKVYVSRKRSRR